MSTTRVASATIASLAIALAVLGGPVAAAGPVTRYVDDDGRAGRSGCGGTRSVPRRVQRAIDAAGPGDTILVCPGTYTEQLTIGGARDGLTVKAVEPWTAVIRTPRDLTGPSPSLIAIDGVDRVRVASLGLAVRTAQPCDRLQYGVRVRGAHGTEVRSLRIGPLGPDTIGRCGYRTGIAVHRGASAFVGYNLIRDFTYLGIWVYGERTTATVYRNSIRYLHGAEAPDPDRLYAVGVLADSGPQVTIRANVIRSGPGPGWPTPVLFGGMDLWLGDGSVVARNTVHRTIFGISTEYTEPVPMAIVRDNVITGGSPLVGSTGLYIEDASTYSGNRVSGYDTGVYAEAGYNGAKVATLRHNDFRGNRRLDCHDGGLSADGTPSTWIANLGNTSDPPGICSPGP